MITSIYFYYYIYNLTFTVCTQTVDDALHRENSADHILITEKLIKNPQFRVYLQHKCFSDVRTNYSMLQKLLAKTMDTKSISLRADFIHMPREALRTEAVVSAKL